MDNIENTITERNTTHGDFEKQAACAEQMYAWMMGSPRFRDLSLSQREALHLIAVKISRILCGDPMYADNWHDIAGYAMLGERAALKYAKRTF